MFYNIHYILHACYNLFYPKPMTILELAEAIKEAITQHTQGKATPTIKVVDRSLPILFNPNEKQILNVDITKTTKFFGTKKLTNPEETIFEIANKWITS